MTLCAVESCYVMFIFHVILLTWCSGGSIDYVVMATRHSGLSNHHFVGLICHAVFYTSFILLALYVILFCEFIECFHMTFCSVYRGYMMLSHIRSWSFSWYYVNPEVCWLFKYVVMSNCHLNGSICIFCYVKLLFCWVYLFCCHANALFRWLGLLCYLVISPFGWFHMSFCLVNFCSIVFM